VGQIEQNAKSGTMVESCSEQSTLSAYPVSFYQYNNLQSAFCSLFCGSLQLSSYLLQHLKNANCQTSAILFSNFLSYSSTMEKMKCQLCDDISFHHYYGTDRLNFQTRQKFFEKRAAKKPQDFQKISAAHGAVLFGFRSP
jgi:hypothetical protein